ncbi:MAG: GIY-YIG nuclease family protein [Candidatus Marinimicrobia bacterium]|nr:GIY-YIG nuclease family protein [Candidatus Neomarinimicrobiota bacterium]
MYFVYILQSQKDQGFYIGFTSNLEKRIKEHNAGKTRSLRQRLPMKLIYHEQFQYSKDAKNREKQIKAFKGGNAFHKLIQSSPRLRRD